MDWGPHGFSYFDFLLLAQHVQIGPSVPFLSPNPSGVPPILQFIFWNLKNGDKKEWRPIIELFIGYLTWPNLIGISRPLSLFFHRLTPRGGVTTNFQKNDLSWFYPEWKSCSSEVRLGQFKSNLSETISDCGLGEKEQHINFKSTP